MNTSNNPYVTYAEIQQQNGIRTLLQTQVPVEHAISLPLPSKRWHFPGYASFAAPAVRIPGEPMRQGAPDRWWVVDARNGRLVAYALCPAIPFGNAAPDVVILPPANRTVATLQQLFADVRSLIGSQAPDFFDGKERPVEERSALKQLLQTVIPAALLPHYQELTPDFFAWLDQN